MFYHVVEKQLFQQWEAMGRQAEQLKLASLVPIKGVWHYMQPWLGAKKKEKKWETDTLLLPLSLMSGYLQLLVTTWCFSRGDRLGEQKMESSL